jgi:hypothetical protein
MLDPDAHGPTGLVGVGVVKRCADPLLGLLQHVVPADAAEAVGPGRCDQGMARDVDLVAVDVGGDINALQLQG